MRLHPRSGALAIAATALLLAGCGGGDEEAATPAPEATETTAPESTPEETPSTETAAGGEEIFAQQCSSCHTLQAAGADGQVGPNLDDAAPDAQSVERKVIAGGGGMPSFQGQLSPEEITAVSEYVAEVAGG